MGYCTLPDILYLQALSQQIDVSQSYIHLKNKPLSSPYSISPPVIVLLDLEALQKINVASIVAHATCLKLIVIISSTRVQVTASMQTAELKSFENRN